MCEQTEINYLDGDIVWVKLGACWWPGQVTGFHNLPEDIQHELKKKPLIAAVKFFQEDTYEFVKNYQQIYKYNCTQKDEFIKKGLDKYRSKSKDGSRYMDKFPGDVEMAEKLTGGDPDILSQDKFCPEEKPNISGLFGEKKIPKKKREREENPRRSDSIEVVRKITHPRFLKESDHEVRIRHQPTSLPSTPNSASSPQYPCHLCNFTSSRVNVIICHIKSHRSGGSPMAKSKVKTYSQYKGRISDVDVDTPKRKYVKKEKTQSNRSKSNSESSKRKQSKQSEKAAKKKKTDPQIRDTILADWEDESDEEITLIQSENSSTTKSQFDLEKSEESNQKNDTVPDTSEIIAETEKLLKETEKLTSIDVTKDSVSGTINISKSLQSNLSDNKSEQEKDAKILDTDIKKSIDKSQKEKEIVSVDNESKVNVSKKDDKKSLLSCFDFHEEEPSIPPVRKKVRVFHQKKEIIKEFEMSQALKTEQEKEAESNKASGKDDMKPKESEKLDTQLSSSAQDSDKPGKNKGIDQDKQANNEVKRAKEKSEVEKVPDVQKSDSGGSSTELEIVEIVEVEKVESKNEKAVKALKPLEVQDTRAINSDKELMENKKLDTQSVPTDNKQVESKDSVNDDENIEPTKHKSSKEVDDILSEQCTTETEDETVSESADTLPEQSENSDVDMLDQDRVLKSDTTKILLNNDKLTFTPQVRKRRGRPKKSESAHTSTSGNTSGNESPKIKDRKYNKKLFEKFELSRRISESDSERSYSGRKRKPNKKYLESDIYVQDVEQKLYRTDESQSESEEISFEKMKSKSRRNKKGVEVDKKRNEGIVLEEQKELEISCSVLNSSENNVPAPSTELKHDLTDNSACKNEMLLEVDIEVSANQPPIETSEKLQVSSEEKSFPEKSDTRVVSEDTTVSITKNISKSESITHDREKGKGNEMETENILPSSDLQQETLKDTKTESSSTFQLEPLPEKEASPQKLDTLKTVDMLPPKKSQIKKFELSQIDFFDTNASTNKTIIQPELDRGQEKLENVKNEVVETNADANAVSPLKQKEDISTEKLGQNTIKPTDEDIGKDALKEEKKIQDREETVSTNQEVHKVEMEISETPELELKLESPEQLSKDAPTVLSEQVQKRSSMQTRYKGKFTPETGAKSKKDKESIDDKSTNTFQEAFLKTLHIDKKKGTLDDSESPGKGRRGKKPVKKKLEDEEDTNILSVTTQDIKTDDELNKSLETFPNNQSEENNSQVTVSSNFEGIEIVVDQNLEVDTKMDDSMFQNIDQLASSSSELGIVTKSIAQYPSIEESSKTISLDIQKLDESSRMSTSTPSPSSDITVPVKKREMPRIIENVTLTEPMQILKSKLLDKLPQKGLKHKLETDSTKKGDQKGSSKAKIMKLESPSSNTKMKTGLKVTSPNLSLTKKLQVLKAEEAETAAMMEAQNEQLNVKTSKTATATTTTEKYIQQSSQSLADMELDINSMPFVLSEDVLTPENIEQMPVVISSIIPASSTIPATLSFTPTTQIVSPTQTHFKLNESTSEVSPTKKKSGTPAILKNKSKAKPTITSIKTLVPPLTGGVKGLKFQSAPATSKVPPLLTQKGTPGKYVVVQTSGGQQLRYSVQGKAGTQQKIAIPSGKSAGNAQIVQQGGKVVILTSAQSGQTKMLPLNISKTLGGKVQRIMTNKGQVLCPISPQGIVNSKTIIAPKGDGVSPTTSKLPAGHKILNTQSIIASKGVLTPISGTIAKTALLGTLSQGILTKGGIYTPISTATLSGKTIIGSKALVTKGTTILSPQNLGTSKAILTPISQALTAKTILSPQGIVSTKATVLTPITGQQVKAIAAKSPSKGTSKVHYQSVQQKVQLPMLQKSQKVSMSSQGRSGQLKAAANTVVLQNTIPAQKTVHQGKRGMKQTVVQQGSLQNISSQGSTQQVIGINPQIQQKGKAGSTSTIQKVIVPRGSRHSKSHQKIVVQKVQEPAITTVQSIHTKQTALTSVPSMSKITTDQKQASATITKASTKGHAISKATQQQKNVLNIAMNSASASNVNANLSASLSLPPLEPIEPERKIKVENVVAETVQKEQPKIEKLSVEKGSEVEKVEEPKVATQPQIMALPTESSDGTQTYVLVTIDDQGQIQPLDNNTLMSLEGTTQNPDGTRTLYIDPSSLGEAGTLDNIVLQFDNGVMPSIQTTVTEPTQTIISESFPTSEVIQTSNQDILAAALANTDFQQEISLSDNPAGSVMTTGLTQTSLINQTILQSTIIPPTEPISSASVLETSLTLNQPIMTPLEVPSSLPIQTESTSTSTIATIPSSLELPITITNPNISYISTGEAQIQIPGNSMPDIGEIMESSGTAEIARTEIPASTQYLVLPNLESNIAVDAQNVQNDAISIPSVSYSVSIPNNMVLQTSQVQTTPSMPIIDDTYTENVQFTSTIEPSITTEQSFVDVPVSEMLVSKPAISTETIQSQDITVTSEMIVCDDVPVSSEESIVSTNEPSTLNEDQDPSSAEISLQEEISSQEIPIKSEEIVLQDTIVKEDSSSIVAAGSQSEEVSNNDDIAHVQIAEQPDESTTNRSSIIDETALVTSESSSKVSPVAHTSFEVSDSNVMETDTLQQSKNTEKLKELNLTQETSTIASSPVIEEQAATSNEVESVPESAQVVPAESLNRLDEQSMDVDEAIDSKMYAASTIKEDCQRDEPSSQGESEPVQRNLELHFEDTNLETNHETPSQSYEQFGVAVTTDSTDLPSQSATKSENSREPSQSITYEPMETDEEAIVTEPPSQSFEHSKINEASQSYETSAEASTNAPTQSFKELMQSQEERTTMDEAIDDQTFPTQSYEVGKAENISENLETDTEISQEGNMPSQSNDIGADGIGTSSVSTNNSGLNEDETASSSYVPETPENQERDPDQESAISTSSCEIPPCAELNIASSSAEHTSIHDNGVPEIPTSSYNLNPDISSTHVDSVPTSSYEEQNVSTSYEVPISMPGLEEAPSQNFVTESTDHRNEPSSYYAHHQEVTASYYESVGQETNSRLDEDPQEEVTPSYYEGNPQEASQSYFNPEEATPSYSSHNVSPSYYDHRPESEASQSYYSTDDIEKTEQSSQNIEASQSFYQEQSDELKLRQQGEATPTYTERYPVDYTLENSPIERHDLVESSVPATKPTER